MKEILKKATIELAKDNIRKLGKAKYLTRETSENAIYHHGINIYYSQVDTYFDDFENKLIEMGYKLIKI